MAGVCPTCRSEWWTETLVCPDCGVDLVEGPLPDPESRAPRDTALPDEWTAGPTSHELTSLDAAGLDDAARWRIGVELDSIDVP